MAEGLPCEDCCDSEDHTRRSRCPQCQLRLCRWCFQIHKQTVDLGAPCRTQKPAMISVPVDRYSYHDEWPSHV